jgi:hypothetical protein
MSSWKAWRQSCGRSVAPISNLCGAYPRRADFRDRHLDRQDIVDEEDGAHVAPVLKSGTSWPPQRGNWLTLR